MAEHVKVAPELLRAIAHPQRLEILTVLDDRAMTLTALVRELRSDRATLARHLRALERAGLVHSADAGNDRLFEAAAIPHYDNVDWGTLSEVIRREAVAMSLARLQRVMTTSLDAGGFDRENIHFSRTALNIGEQDFDRLSAEFDGLLDRVDELQKETEDRGTHATAVLMLFENAPSEHRTVDDHGKPDTFTTLEGRERAYDLHERISDLVIEPDVDWDAALNAVDELRVVLHAARLAAQRERDSLRRSVQAVPTT